MIDHAFSPFCSLTHDYTRVKVLLRQAISPHNAGMKHDPQTNGIRPVGNGAKPVSEETLRKRRMRARRVPAQSHAKRPR